jgi:hypothetical protein
MDCAGTAASQREGRVEAVKEHAGSPSPSRRSDKRRTARVRSFAHGNQTQGETDSISILLVSGSLITQFPSHHLCILCHHDGRSRLKQLFSSAA